jgi:hypothetical protein
MEQERVKGFADKVFGDMAGAMTAGLGFVGVKSGLFRAMAGKGFLTPVELAGTTKLQSRYVEEWLKAMVCAGYLEYEPDADTYRLPDEHAFLLASEGTDHFMGGLFCMAPVLLRVAPSVALAFKRGGGVPFEEYGADGVEALGSTSSASPDIGSSPSPRSSGVWRRDSADSKSWTSRARCSPSMQSVDDPGDSPARMMTPSPSFRRNRIQRRFARRLRAAESRRQA